MRKRCDYYQKDERRCQKTARVKVIYRYPNAKGTASLPNSVYRCWKHYLELENAARHPNANFQITKAVVLE